jgi:hypothetical protein
MNISDRKRNKHVSLHWRTSIVLVVLSWCGLYSKRQIRSKDVTTRRCWCRWHCYLYLLHANATVADVQLRTCYILISTCATRSRSQIGKQALVRIVRQVAERFGSSPNDIFISATYTHNCARAERMKSNTHASPAKNHSEIVLLPQTYICVPVTYKPNCARTNEYICSETQQTCISALAIIDCASCAFLALY